MSTNGHTTLIDEVEELLAYINLSAIRRYRSTGIPVVLRDEQVEALRAAVDREREGAAIIKDQEARMSTT